jgi:ADP-ribose pyrophosphatase
LGNYFVAHKAPVAVLILVREDGKVYLVKQYERGVGEVGYKFPVTRVGEHEQPHEAAKRGLPEETGFSSKDMTYLGETYVDPGFMTTRAHFYLCMSLVAQKAAKKNSLLKPCIGEWMDFSELTKIILENRVKNPFVISGYMLAKVHLEKYYKNR